MLIGLTLPAYAEAQSIEVCKAVTSFGTYDTANIFTNKQKLNQTKNVVCSKSMETYSSAKAASLDIGLDVVSVFDAAFGGSTTTKNYSQRRLEYCKLTYANANASLRLSESYKEASEVISNAFNQCIFLITRQQGFLGYVVQSRNRDAFSIHLSYNTRANNVFKLEGIEAAPSGVTCTRREHKATKAQPIEITGSQTILCKPNQPGDSILLAVNTSVGDIRGPGGSAIELPGTRETLADIQERVEAMEGRLVKPQSIAFFASTSCPFGWEKYEEMAGRYVVGLPPGGRLLRRVGKPLSDGENRATGRHAHGYSPVAFEYGAKHGGQPRAKVGGPGTTNHAGGVDGTNAPYIQLTACIKR